MRIQSCSLFICAGLFGSMVFGQSISVGKKADGSIWIEGAAPAGSGYTLQGSANFRLWVDLQNDLPAQYSVELSNDWFDKQFFRLRPPEPEAPPIRVLALGSSLASDCCG